MKALVIGSGGREHALVWALTQERRRITPFCVPGNPGIAVIATCLPGSPLDGAALADAAEQHGIDLTIVGPDDTLAAGVVDVFAARGLPAFGPTRAAAQLEASKVFMKTLCRQYEIPTAEFRVFDRAEEAVAYLRRAARPLVVKADGLCAGKGVVVAGTVDEAVAAAETMMVQRRFGDAGARVVIEEVLDGEEVSVFALCDGTTVVPLLPVQDHKRVGEGDTGPNTGGMGAYAPVPSVRPELLDRITDRILEPAVWAMTQEGRPFRGVLYAGMMLTSEGPRVLEFNVRFGDPEAQVLVALLESGLSEAIEAAMSGTLDRVTLRWRPRAAVSVALCAEGYPAGPRTGSPISGLDEAASLRDVLVFHAGTARRDGQVVTAGGRVLHVVGIGDTLHEARARAYHAAGVIEFDGKMFRRDIAARAGAEERAAHT